MKCRLLFLSAAILATAVSPKIMAAQATSTNATIVAATAGTNDEVTAWAALQKSKRAPAYPAEWQTTPPTAEQQNEFRLEMAKKAEAVAESAKDFAARFPNSNHLPDATALEKAMRINAKNLGAPSTASIADAAEAPAAVDPLDVEMEKLFRDTMKGFDPAQPAPTIQKLMELGEAFQIAHPDTPASYRFLLSIAVLPGADGIAIANKVLKSSAPEKFKEFAASILKKSEAIGKPMTLKFAAVDGRAVDISLLKGKVVMVDFWATWCGPCMAALPEVIDIYDKLHEKGMEIIGISLDEDKDELTSFLKKKKMSWPQYFEGSWQNNQFVKEFGVEGIPSVWLIDKKGIVRTRDFRGDLEAEIKKLLDEK
ncbi:MAG: resA 1 [Verrucomicrobiales bacterium]|nr:resA 1 [Verrucomicrobiales bacterium]